MTSLKKAKLSPGYLANKAYRTKYPKRRAAERKRNYTQTAGPDLNFHHRARWTRMEIRVLEMWCLTDRELHLFLGRSVQAIQNKRHLLRQTAKTQKAPRPRKEVSLES